MPAAKDTIDFINSKTGGFKPVAALVLGSGLNSLVEGVDGISVKYSDIPHFGTSSVQGHKGELLFLTIENKPVVAALGRFHFYEGNSMAQSAYPVKVFKALGCQTLILTNAAGAAHKGLSVGDIMLIDDHINFMGSNPLIGKNNDAEGERFPDMTNCYDKDLKALAFDCAEQMQLELKRGIYLATSGPSYETAAEVRAYRTLGADVVGMSTVPEAIVASWLKLKTLAFSVVTNYATGISDKALSHREVIEGGKIASEKLAKLIKKIVSSL